MYFDEDEVDGVSAEDQEATSKYYQDLINETLPQHQAKKLAREHYGIELDDKTLNSILQRFACTSSSLPQCVEDSLYRAGLI